MSKKTFPLKKCLIFNDNDNNIDFEGLLRSDNQPGRSGLNSREKFFLATSPFI